MEKLALTVIFVFIIVVSGVNNMYGQSCGNGITYTSSYAWVSGHGTLSTPQGTKHNDLTRLN
jgi:hypothetical protein